MLKKMIEYEKLPESAACQDENGSVLYTDQRSHPLIKFIVILHLPGSPSQSTKGPFVGTYFISFFKNFIFLKEQLQKITCFCMLMK